MKIRREFIVILILCAGLFSAAFFEAGPVERMMNWKASRNATATRDAKSSGYEIYDHSNGSSPVITIDFLMGKHFWNPQLVIWLEDSAGNYIETLFVTSGTARGLFYSGRSASNFRNADTMKPGVDQTTRRVDALPYWSHKRGHLYPDGFYSPPPSEPLPDGITGATPAGNFKFSSVIPSTPGSFRVMVEVNVAFDDNEYYSEYDFPDDSLYHGGTGLLGQPSLVYAATVTRQDENRYHVLSLIGHGHHSGQTGDLVEETRSISTAKYIVERIVVGIDESWYQSKKE